MTTPAERAEIDAAKAASVAQVLFKTARLLNDRALERMRVVTGHPFRAAHTSVLPHIDLAGTRPTELARRMGISKQAVGQLIAELEAWGTVERVPDPTDGRAKLVRFRSQEDGRHAILAGIAVLGEVESELAEHVGAERWAALHHTLLQLLALLEDPAGRLSRP